MDPVPIRGRFAPADLPPRLRLVAALSLVVGLLCAGYLLTDRFGSGGLVLLGLHAGIPLAALPVLLCAVRGRHRRVGLWLMGLTIVGGLAAMLPVHREVRGIGVHSHAILGLLAAGTAAAAWVRSLEPGTARPRLAALVFILCVTPALAVYAAVERKRASWSPPRYDPAACFRFLTATTLDQAGEPNFPSALRAEGEAGTCLTAGCHSGVHADWAKDAHAQSGRSRAYGATFTDFVARRGTAAGRWCQGCHNPDSQRGPTGSGVGGVGCLSCHGTKEVHALYGSAPLVLAGDAGRAGRIEPGLRPEGHAHRNLRGGLQASAEFCGACHRKNWSLPQNGFHWMTGPDEYRQWLTSPYSGSYLLSSAEEAPPRACVGCHDPHGAATPRRPALEIDAFARLGGAAVPLAATLPILSPARTAEIDFVIRNAAIGHDFPYGMPDLHEAWLAVEIRDRAGTVVLRSRQPDSGAALYSLEGLDRDGKPIRRGDLDRMTRVLQWRRIGAGEADLARYRLTVPAGGVGSVRARVLRRRRPDFSRWAGEPVQTRPEVVAEWNGRPTGAAGLRRYGLALARSRLFAPAIGALTAALGGGSADGETLLALGQVFLREGDLLAAEERFRRAEAALPDRSRAWLAVVLRRSGRLEQAVTLLRPLVGRHPRDPGLRFELGRALMELLRHREAVVEFEALLSVDPLDVAGHHNLMRCWQRLNRPAEARREEALYELLSSPDDPAHTHEQSGSGGRLEVLTFEAVR